MGATVVLVLTVMLNLPGIGERTSSFEFPRRFTTLAECQAAVEHMKQLNNPSRHIDAVCRQSV